MIKLPDEIEHRLKNLEASLQLAEEQRDYWINRARKSEAEVQRLNATAQPVSDGWVKCSDRMPKEEQMVIVWAETPVTEYSKYAYWNESEKQWWGDDEKQIYKVTHWMPLPAAPGGQ